MNQLEQARKGIATKDIEEVASSEGVDPQFIIEGMAAGHIIIPRNKNHTTIPPIGIGKGLRTKINANIGTSKDHQNVEEELKKLRISVKSGADTVMDLSTGGPLDEIRNTILKESTVPIGTVPVYQAVIEAVQSDKAMVHMSTELLFKVIEKHAEDGVDFITVHCGLTRESAGRLKREGRLMDVVSRGGAFTVEWMAYNKKENPLYEHYDRLLDIAREYDLTLSLGDGLRPGCLADATDRGQVQELIILGELAERARAKDVQVMIEGPGHVPIHQITTNVQLQKQLCHGAPFYVLGPLVIDIAPGYDHITSAIGGALAASAGADFLFYVTPSEHLRLPTTEDVKTGVIASKIAAHAADIAKGVKGAMEKDIKMAECRKKMDWKRQIELSLDPDLADQLRSTSQPADKDVCTMCGEFCAIKLLSKEELWKYFDNF
ncbi:MAG: phosphomethylpyrimidine synthase ThiC [Deltaproteobacteria bacterium]|nr:phosphomethylpyrimidine synthase ThiC [Deltaproteobacteria bacterium]